MPPSHPYLLGAHDVLLSTCSSLEGTVNLCTETRKPQSTGIVAAERTRCARHAKPFIFLDNPVNG